MSQDFVTELRLQLREAARREEQRAPAARRLLRVRRRVPGPGPLAAALAVALLALAVAVGALALRGEPEPTAPKVVRTFRVADGLTSMAQGFGAVWATDLSSGNVLRIDPKTRKVVARIPVAGGAAAAGAPACPQPRGDRRHRLRRGVGARRRSRERRPQRRGATPAHRPPAQPRRRRDPADQAVRRQFSPRALHVGDDSVWVIGTAGALQIDPASNAPERYVPTGDTAARGVLADGDTLWLLDVDGRLRQIDGRTGRTVRTVRVPVTTGTHLAGGGPGPLMLVDDQRLTAFDPTTAACCGAPRSRAPCASSAGPRRPLWAYLDRTPERRDRLVRIDAGTGRRTGQVDLPGAGAAGLAQVGRDLWIAGVDGRITVVR